MKQAADTAAPHAVPPKDAGSTASVERTVLRALAALAFPVAAAGVVAAFLAQRQVDAAAQLGAVALPQFVAAQRLSGDVYALTNYAQQFQTVSTLAERATLQERIDGRAVGVDRALGELQRLAGGDSPILRQLSAARVDLTAGVADLVAATEAVVRSGEALRALTGRLRGEGAQSPDNAALAALRELTALAAAAPTPLTLRNIARQFDLAMDAAPDNDDVRRLAALMRGEDGVAATRRRELEARQQQRFMVRRQADAGDRMAAVASALTAEAQQALDAAGAAAAAGAERLRWLLAAAIVAGAASGFAGLRLLRRRVVSRLVALCAMVAASRAAYPPESPPVQGDELDRLAGGVRGLQAEIERQAAEIARLRGSDPLTGLADRRSFFAALSVALARLRAAGAAAEPADGAAILLMDIDHFEAVNDLLGVSAGDRALERLAGLLRRRCGEGQIAARLEGDCFAVLLPGVEAAEAEIFAMRLRQSAADERRGEDVEQAPPVTVSIGVARLEPADRSVDDAHRRAAAALRRAKSDGRNRVATASTSNG